MAPQGITAHSSTKYQPPLDDDCDSSTSGTADDSHDIISNVTSTSRNEDFESKPKVEAHKAEAPKLEAKILYRYIHKDVDGDVIFKKESPEPIIFTEQDDSATGLTDDTVLEIVTTKRKGDSSRAPSLISTVMKIHSKFLINALKEVIRYYPTVSFHGSPVIVQEPYQPLIHYMKELEHYKSKHPTGHNKSYIAVTNAHIDVLLGFLNRTYGDDLALELERHQRQPPVATFGYLWLLFRPGDQIYCHENDDSDAVSPFVVHHTRLDPVMSLLSMWNIHYLNDNESMALFNTTIPLTSFEGEKEITSLKFFPVRFHEKHVELKARYIARGKKYSSFSETSYVDYSGAAVSPPSIVINGKVMVDNKSWFKYQNTRRAEDYDSVYEFEARNRLPNQLRGEGCDCLVCDAMTNKPHQELPFDDFFFSLKDDLPLVNSTTSDDFYFLCSHIVRGYALKERKWVELHIDQIRELDIEPDPFSNLMLESDIKDTIESLVWNYAQTDSKVKSWSKDFVRDKGEGRIFLLHGSPGVGKTCTAECVADLIRRPLLSLTCGDMGITASEVEKNFKSYFELGELWGAVVLMDEADVYLEQRTTENLERNSLVSVFLRALEYFRGILFLTTNRVGAFDDAFISRIHVALHYKRLNDEYRSKIWEKNFHRLSKEGAITVSPPAIFYAVAHPEMRAVEWNGREIRNALQTSVALAQYQARKEGKTQAVLEVHHLKRVVKMSKQFKDYITSTHKNQDEVKRAMIEERRNDAFDVRPV